MSALLDEPGRTTTWEEHEGLTGVTTQDQDRTYVLDLSTLGHRRHGLFWGEMLDLLVMQS